MLRSRSIAWGLAVVALTATSTGCLNPGNPRDAVRFCTLVRDEQPGLTNATDPAALVDLYRTLDKHAPLQIMDEWHRLVVLLGRVTTYDPKDSTDTQNVIIEALQAQGAMNAVAKWVKRECKLDLGPVPTTVPG